MANRVNENLVTQASPFGDSMNPKSGNWLAAEFRTFAEIADYLNDARVNIRPDNIIYVNSRFYVLFLVDSSAKMQVNTVKTKTRKKVNNGKRISI